MKRGKATFLGSIGIFCVMVLLSLAAFVATAWVEARDGYTQVAVAFEDDQCRLAATHGVAMISMLAFGLGVGFMVGIAERRRTRGAILER